MKFKVIIGNSNFESQRRKFFCEKMLPSSPNSTSPAPMKSTLILSSSETSLTNANNNAMIVSSDNNNNNMIIMNNGQFTNSVGGVIHKTADTTNRNPNRRSNKPIMEKRRRARINNCLNELKAILLDAMRKDPARHSKLEKADILELTVSHLKSLHQSTNNSVLDSTSKFREGFAECIAEVGRFLSTIKLGGFNSQVTGRLLSHLADCIGSSALQHSGTLFINELNNNNIIDSHNIKKIQQQQQQSSTSYNNIASNASVISLVPSRLPSGDFAFVVPAGFNSSAFQLMPTGNNSSFSNNSNSQIQQEQSQRVTEPSSMVSPRTEETNNSSFNKSVPTYSTQRHQRHQQVPMLSPEVPLELTVSPTQWSSSDSNSPSVISICSSSPPTSYRVGPAYPVNSARGSKSPQMYHHHHRQIRTQQQPYNVPSRYFNKSRLELQQQGSPLSLVTPKREGVDMSCWRPW